MTTRLTTRPLPKAPAHALVALLLAFFAFCMSALVSQNVFERLPHLEDEMSYLYQARTYAGGNFVIPSPEPHRAYWQPFLIDQSGLRFGKYPPGWSIQLALGTLMGQEWIINAFFAALTVALVYRLGHEIFNPDVGVVAAALTAFSPMALLLAGTLMGHTSALFAATLFLYAYWRIERGRRTLLWGAVAGIALGLLIANRPLTAIAVAAPVILWSGIRLVRALAWNLSGGRDANAGSVRETLRRAMKAKTVETSRVSLASAATMDTIPVSPITTITHEVRPVAPTTSSLATAEVTHVQPESAFAQPRYAPRRGFFATLSPLIILSVFTLLLAAIVPLNNYLAVGSPTKDLYTLVWSYDQVGFGSCCGRSGHTLEKGIRQAGFDLSLTAADLFGWQIRPMYDPAGTLMPDLQNHLINEGDYWDGIGISWILLPLAALVAYRRKTIFIVLWVAAAYGWLQFASHFQDGAQLRNPIFAWLWLLTALALLYLPLLFWRDRMRAWTWLLWSVAGGLVVVHMAYWVGSQRYSTRYYFEGLTAIAIISALPIAWLARHLDQPINHLQRWIKVIRNDWKKFSFGDLFAVISSVVVGIAFFSMFWLTFSGQDSGMGSSLLPTDQYGIWLIPLAFGVGLVSAVWGLFDFSRKSAAEIIAFAAGVMGLVYYAIFFLQDAQHSIDSLVTLALGFWVALLGLIGLVVQVFIPRPAPVLERVHIVPMWRSQYNRPLVYGLLALALGYSLYFYSTPRISALRGYNFISQQQVQAIEARRTGDQPVLVVVNGAGMRWRAMGALMAMTSPYLNGDIVAAWNYEGTNGTVKQQILDRFPDRQVIELEAQDNYWWFEGDLPPPEVASLGSG